MIGEKHSLCMSDYPAKIQGQAELFSDARRANLGLHVPVRVVDMQYAIE